MESAAIQRADLYYHERWDCYECLDCQTMIEVPRWAVLTGGRVRVPVKGHPENRLLWLELQRLDHGPCAAFQSAEQAQQARTYRKAIVQARPGQPRVLPGAPLPRASA
jgi:hypothetical protein